MSSYAILWLGDAEWESHEGTLESAIASVKSDKRYANYGRRGALILRYDPIYRIEIKPVEEFFTAPPCTKSEG